MQRTIIEIDEEKCTGCGQCIPNCPEGALQIIDNKARLVSDLMCDGLGACLGHCPEGAIATIKRQAEAYDERKVMANIVKQGVDTIKAHLTHLKSHGQTAYFNQVIEYLMENKIIIPLEKENPMHDTPSGCPGSRTVAFTKSDDKGDIETGKRPSQLSHWPVQMHLISPVAPHYKGSDMVLAADCVAYALGDFHQDHLKGKTLAIACPKLDERQEVYGEKIKALVDDAEINTLTVMIMQVPCCNGLLALAQRAAAAAKRKIPIKSIVVGLQGEILREEWI